MKELATKTDGLSSSPDTSVVKGETWLTQIDLWCSCVRCHIQTPKRACAETHKSIDLSSTRQMDGGVSDPANVSRTDLRLKRWVLSRNLKASRSLVAQLGSRRTSKGRNVQGHACVCMCVGACMRGCVHMCSSQILGWLFREPKGRNPSHHGISRHVSAGELMWLQG